MVAASVFGQISGQLAQLGGLNEWNGHEVEDGGRVQGAVQHQGDAVKLENVARLVGTIAQAILKRWSQVSSRQNL